MRFFYLCAAGAITLEVLSRGVNFATALKHDASKASSTTELVRKDTRVSKEKRIDESFPAANGHRSLEAVDLEWVPMATDLGQIINCRYVAMSQDGKTVALGYPDDNAYIGRVKVYTLSDGSWVPKGAEDFVGDHIETLGSSVSLSGDGNILAIGRKHNKDIANNAGQISVFKYENNLWNPMGQSIKGNFPNQRLGIGVLSEDGMTLATRSVHSNDSITTQDGSVKVYRYFDGQWEPKGGLLFDENNPHGNFGYSISLSANGDILGIGVPGARINDVTVVGYFHVFEFIDDGSNNGAWQQMGTTISGEIDGQNMGETVSLSAEGHTIAVSSTNRNNGFATVYKYINGQWMKHGQTIHSELYIDGAAGGRGLSLSANGNFLAIGYIFDDKQGSDSGFVRVYEYTGEEWEPVGQDLHSGVEKAEFGRYLALSGNGYTLVAAGHKEMASVYRLPVIEEWDGVWFIDYDSVALSGDVLTSTYLTKPDVKSDFTVSHTIGACDSNGAALGNPAITNVVSTATVVDDEMSDTLSVAKTLNAAAIVDDHDGELNFCETVTLTNSGGQEAETVDVVQAQAYFTVTASFLAEIGTYSSVTLVDESSVTIVDEQSLSPEGTIAVERCGGLSDSINPGDKLCLEIFVSDSSSVGVDRIHNLDLKQGTSTFAAIDDGSNQYSALVEESCVDGTCTVDIVVPGSLFTDESGASELTLSITGDAYLYEKGGAKDENESESKDFSYSVTLEKPCKGGLLRGFVESMLSP